MEGTPTAELERRILRVCVESVELELDDDDSLLITSLQSALPGASGLYYNEDCKTSVKFDGKRLLPPNGGWKDRKYFATLGCRSFDYPFGTYANASKQFERSVNAVQRLLGRSKVYLPDVLGDEEYVLKKKMLVQTEVQQKASEEESKVPFKTENMKQILASLTQRQSGEEDSQSEQKLTPLEQQFVELARISTSKDIIIEKQRSELNNIQEKLLHLEKSLKAAMEDLVKSEKRCGAQEEELSVLRNLTRDQTYMCDKVNELTRKNVENQELLHKQREEIENLTQKLAEAAEKEKEYIRRTSELEGRLDAAVSDIDQLENKLSSIKNTPERKLIESKEHELECSESLDVLSALKARNTKLENDMNAMDEKYSQLIEGYNKLVAETTHHGQEISVEDKSFSDTEGLLPTLSFDEAVNWKKEAEQLKTELAVSEKKVAELTELVDRLTADATESEKRAQDALSQRQEMKRSLDLAETKIQITITK